MKNSVTSALGTEQEEAEVREAADSVVTVVGV